MLKNMMTFEKAYSILNVNDSVSKEDLKSIYKDLCKQNHPDKGGNAELFNEIVEAYEFLVENENYDEWDLFEKILMSSF